MLKTVFASTIAAVALLLSAAAVAQAPAAPSPYASEACKTGCVFFERESVVYSGATARSYRICAGRFSITAMADTRTVTISSHFCADVNGATIKVSGEAYAGLLPS